MRTALERKRFIASQKTKKATSLLKELQDKRLICFTGSVAQAKELGGKYAVHSKNKNNQELIDNFNDYQSDKLFAVGMLREGMNLSSLDCAVIVQLDNQEKSLVQMTGRSLRSLAPKVFIIVLRDTMDMKYLEKAKSVFNPEYIKKYEQTAI
jgi:superfamily II DNA or RNA helicase